MDSIPGLSIVLGLSLAILLNGCSTTGYVDCASTTTTVTCTSEQWMDYAKRQKLSKQSQNSLGQGSLYDMSKRK